MKNDKISRKDFIKQLGLFGAISVGGSSLLTACGGGGNQQESGSSSEESSSGSGETAAADPCTDVSGLTDQELQMRKNLQYTGSSPHPDKDCTNCALYIPAEGDASCGSCQLVKGPINPKGYCTSWSAKQT